MPEPNVTVMALSQQEKMKLEMICMDNDKEGALSFCKDIRLKINQTVKGMKSHLDS